MVWKLPSVDWSAGAGVSWLLLGVALLVLVAIGCYASEVRREVP